MISNQNRWKENKIAILRRCKLSQLATIKVKLRNYSSTAACTIKVNRKKISFSCTKSTGESNQLNQFQHSRIYRYRPRSSVDVKLKNQSRHNGTNKRWLHYVCSCSGGKICLNWPFRWRQTLLWASHLLCFSNKYIIMSIWAHIRVFCFFFLIRCGGAVQRTLIISGFFNAFSLILFADCCAWQLMIACHLYRFNHHVKDFANASRDASPHREWVNKISEFVCK